MINRRQFILAKKRYYSKDFSSLQLKDGYILSFHKQLNIYQSNQNNQGIIIGFAWQTDPTRCSPIEELDQLLLKTKVKPEDVYQMERTWCGRYVLIIESNIYLDATGMLGIFYSNNALSSSYSILCDVLGIKKKYPDKSFGIGLGFQPGIFTMHKKIRRLLPSQIYNYTEKKLLYRQLLPEFDSCLYSKNQILDTFIYYFKCSLQNMRATIDGELWLSLTGGHDSRTLMALLEYAEIPYKCFTLDVTNMSDGDKVLPQMLAESTGKPFIFLKRNPWKFSAHKIKEYISHSNGFAKDQDVLSYAFRQYAKLSKNNHNIVILRSGIWGIVMKYFRQFCDSEGKLDIYKIKKSYPQLINDGYAMQSLMHYLKYIEKHEALHLDPVDRYHWEIRVGSWLSSIEQSCDIMDNTTFLQPCNSRIFLTLLGELAKQEKEPWKKYHEEKIIQKCCPKLNYFAFDDNYPHKLSLKNIILNIYYTFLSKRYLYGIKNTLYNAYCTLQSIQRLYGFKDWLKYKFKTNK